MDSFLHKYMYTCAKSLQSCLTLWDPMECSLPGSSVHGILQARILEWVSVPSSTGSAQPKLVSPACPALAGCTTWEAPYVYIHAHKCIHIVIHIHIYMYVYVKYSYTYIKYTLYMYNYTLQLHWYKGKYVNIMY